MYILSADFGTSSVKTAVMDERGNIYRLVKKSYSYFASSKDGFEILVEDIENAFLASVEELNAYIPQVEAVSFDCFAPSVILMDENGNALCPLITHLDRRSRQQSREILNKIDAETFLGITGTLPHAGGVTLTTLLWIKKHQPQLYKKIYKVGHLSTYLFKKLTGNWGIDTVNASITGMYETIAEGGWSETICGRLGVDMDLLPPVRDLHHTAAPLLEEMKQRMGCDKDVAVMLGTQDCASALLGAGAQKPGDVLCISGSSEMVCILTDRPHISRDYYVRATGKAGLWQIFCITSGGFALDWFRREFYREMAEEEFFREYLPGLLTQNFDCNGIRFYPYLSGDRQSLRKKRGGFAGLTLDSKRDEMLCALLLGIQEPSAQILKKCSAFMPENYRLKATGNMAENPAYLELKRKVLGVGQIELTDNCPLRGNAAVVRGMYRSNRLIAGGLLCQVK